MDYDPFLIFLIIVLKALSCSCDHRKFPTSPIHIPIKRRGGPFPTSENANLTFLLEELSRAESRFYATKREMQGNKLVRKPKNTAVGGSEAGLLMAEAGRLGAWYADIQLGTPWQSLELDLDMLTADFFVFRTTSRLGSQFHDGLSQSFMFPGGDFPYPTCRYPSDKLLIPGTGTELPISFAFCRPSHSSLHTLLPSGAVLGLAPSASLSQTKKDSLLNQLLEKKAIHQNIWNLMLINGQQGVLTLGGTSNDAVSKVNEEIQAELEKTNTVDEKVLKVKRGTRSAGKGDYGLKPRDDDDDAWRAAWKWSKVQGAAGWWQILMQGIWVGGSKILKNQPVVLDVCPSLSPFQATSHPPYQLTTPFILAPPQAATAFYASIPGARALPAPHANFYTFPCLNPPTLHLEFGAWNFPVLHGGGAPGGKMSLGRLRDGSGYCVGAVVASTMGGANGGGAAGRSVDGMLDVWVVGGPFFRDVSVVFDVGLQSVGMRTF
ncbi:MAG: hypothetical protein M1829_005500 [Trizodia sp. TS-e1964]|nr:MAG: hypothetical protein M1829_005500 [Trizodia sp. TS-e1964]